MRAFRSRARFIGRQQLRIKAAEQNCFETANINTLSVQERYEVFAAKLTTVTEVQNKTVRERVCGSRP